MIDANTIIQIILTVLSAVPTVIMMIVKLKNKIHNHNDEPLEKITL